MSSRFKPVDPQVLDGVRGFIVTIKIGEIGSCIIVRKVYIEEDSVSPKEVARLIRGGRSNLDDPNEWSGEVWRFDAMGNKQVVATWRQEILGFPDIYEDLKMYIPSGCDFPEDIEL